MEYSTWEPKKSSWSAQERRARSTVRTLFVHLFILIIIIRPKSSGGVTHDSHKLQTKAIHHSTSRYMNHRELQSDEPIHVPLLRVISFPPSDGISALARRCAPHLATTLKDMDNASCNVLFMFYTATRIQRRLLIGRTAMASMKPFKQRPVCEASQSGVRCTYRCD